MGATVITPSSSSVAAAFSSIVFSTPAATVNLSTLGDLDWIYANWDQNAYTSARGQHDSVGGVHHKLWGAPTGLGLIDTLRPVRGTTVPSHNTNSIAGTTYQSTAADDSIGTAVNSTTYSVMYTTANSAPINFGWEFSFPSRSTAQVVRVYFSASGSSDIVVDAAYSHSAATATNTQVASVGQSVYLATFTATGGLAGEVVRVRIRATTNASGTISVCLGGITIGTA